MSAGVKGATAGIRVVMQAAAARRQAKLLERDLVRARSAANFSNLKGLTRVGRNFRDLTNQANALGNVMSRSGSTGVGMFKRLSVASRIAVGALGTLGNAITGLGRDMQWLGRQIEFRISLPLLLATGLATKFALDNEAAFTKIRKVYGGAADDIGKFDADLKRLRIAFVNLSDTFGVHQKDVLDVAATWAQAGAQGVFLANAVKLSIETAILGEIGLADATQGLLVIQQAYQLNIKELTDAVAVLNQVENETTATLPNLIEVFQDAAGAAMASGTSIRQLAAVTAALIPVAGSASEVGNALKTIMARIVAPTNQAAAAFKAIGVDVNSMDFATAGLTDKLFMLSRGFDELSKSQQANFIRDVFQLRQFSRASILLTDLLNKYSRYDKAIQATSSAQANQNKFNQELLTFLESSPQKVKILTTRIQNMLAEVGIQFLPILTTLLRALEAAFRAFNKLSASTKRTIMIIAAAVAIIGPLLGVLGALVILLGVIIRPFAFFTKILITLPSAVIHLVKHLAIMLRFMMDLVLWLPRVVLGLVQYGVAILASGVQTTIKFVLALVDAVATVTMFAWSLLGPAASALYAFGASMVKVAITYIPMVLAGLGQLILVLLDLSVLALGGVITALRPMVIALLHVGAAALSAAAALGARLAAALGAVALSAAATAAVLLGRLGAALGVLYVQVGVFIVRAIAMATAIGARLATALAAAGTQVMLLAVRLSTLSFAYVIRNAMMFAGILIFMATRAITAVMGGLAALSARLLLVSVYLSTLTFEYVIRNAMLFAGTLLFLAGRAIGAVITSLSLMVIRLGAVSFTALIGGLLSSAWAAGVLAAQTAALTFSAVIRNVMLFAGTLMFLATRAVMAAAISISTLIFQLGQLTFTSVIGGMITFARWAVAAVVQTTGAMISRFAALSTMMFTRVVQAFASVIVSMAIFATQAASTVAAAVTPLIVSMFNLARSMATQLVTAAASAVTSLVRMGAAMIWTAVTAAGRLILSLGTLALTMVAGMVPSIAGLMLNLSLLAVAFLQTGKAALFAAGRMVVAWLSALAPIVIKIALVAAAIGVLNEITKRIFGKSIPDLIRQYAKFLGDAFNGMTEMLGNLGDDFTRLVNKIKEGVDHLPKIFGDALQGVVDLLSGIIPVIWDLLSYLNPFATHSPSLVSQVKDGVDAIIGHYDRATVIVGLFNRAAKNLDKFTKASAAARASLRDKDIASQRAVVAAVAPGAVGAFDLVARDIHDMNAEMELLNSAIDAQQIVVNKWANALKEASAVLEEAQSVMDGLVNKANEIADQISAAQDQISVLANTPITGMNAAADAIDATTFEMKKLQLQMLQLEQAQGPIEDTQSALAKLAGELELMRGKRNDLRLAGAGSDVLNTVDTRIAELEAAQNALQNGTSNSAGQQIADLQAQIDALDLQNQIAQLQFGIDYGPMLDQIDALVNPVQEMDFNAIIEGIQAGQENIANLGTDLSDVNAEIAAQADVVAAAQQAFDDAQATYDTQLAKLEGMKEGYKALAEKLRDAEAALRDFNTAATSGGAGTDPNNPFGPAGDTPTVTGSGANFGAAGFDQKALDDFIKENLKKDGIDPFNMDAVNEKIKELKAKLKEIQDKIGGYVDKIKAKWQLLRQWWDKNYPVIREYLRGLADWFRRLGEKARDIWDIVWKFLTPAFQGLADAGRWLLDSVRPVFDELSKWGPMFHDLVNIILGVVGAVIWFVQQVSTEGTILNQVFKVILDFAKGTWNGIIDIIVGALEVIRGVWTLFSSLFKGDWKGMWDATKLIFKGIWDIIVGILERILARFVAIWDLFKIGFGLAWKVWWGVVKTVFMIVWDKMLAYGKLILGKIKDAMYLAKAGILTAWNTIWNNIKGAFDSVWGAFKGAVKLALDGVKGAIDTAKSGLQTAWDAITGIFRTAADNIKAVLDPIVTVIEKIVDFVKNPPSLSDIPGIGGVIGSVTSHIPNLFAKGGVTSGVSIVGEGRPQYPEFVIPTDPLYARRAQGLLALANKSLAPRGIQRPSAGRGLVNAVGGGSKQTTNNFNGDLVFPNITDGADARAFIENLTSLIDDTTT